MPQPRPNPSPAYSRTLTKEGGVLIRYKDIDDRWRYRIWRWGAWITATAFEGWLLFTAAPPHKNWVNVAGVLAAGFINFLILRKPIELHRSLEIRPDCLVMDGTQAFFLELMEGELPQFFEDDDGNLVLAGFYGTRFVEYATARRFDDADRMPDVFAAHFKQATEQLWAPAIALGTIRRGSSPELI
jgi:hypothetical protein